MHGGGIISSKFDRHNIRLAVPGKEIHEDGTLDPKFIADCVEKNELLCMNKYQLRCGTRAAVKDDDLEPAHHIIQMEARTTRGRKKYLLSEDMALIKYLLSTNSYSLIGGNVIWKEMEFREAVPGHSWQSLKHRYRTCILPNIHIYALKEFEVAKLLNSAATNRTTEIENEDSDTPEPEAPVDGHSRETSKSTLHSPKKNASSKKNCGNNNGIYDDFEILDEFDRELLSLASSAKEQDASKSKEKKGTNDRHKIKIQSESKNSDDCNNRIDVLDESALPPPLKRTRSSPQPEDTGSADELSSPTTPVSKLRKASPTKNVMVTGGVTSEHDNVSNNEGLESPTKRKLRSSNLSPKKKSFPKGKKQGKANVSTDESRSPAKRHLRPRGLTSDISSLRKTKVGSLSDGMDLNISGDMDDFDIPVSRMTRRKVPLTMLSSKQTATSNDTEPHVDVELSEGTKGSSDDDLANALAQNKRVLQSNDDAKLNGNQKNLDDSLSSKKQMLSSKNLKCKASVPKDQDLSGVRPFELIDSESESGSENSVRLDSLSKPCLRAPPCHPDKRCNITSNKYKKMPQSPITHSSEPQESDSGSEVSSVSDNVTERGAAASKKKTAKTKRKLDSGVTANVEENGVEIHRHPESEQHENIPCLNNTHQNSSVFPKCYSHKKKTPSKEYEKKASLFKPVSISSSDSDTDIEAEIPDAVVPKARPSYQRLGSSLRQFLMTETQSTQSQFSQPDNEEEPVDVNTDQVVLETSKKFQICIQETADVLQVTPRALFFVCHWVGGSLDDALSYILNGKRLNGKPVWKMADDTMLQNGGEAEYHVLEEKYGEDEILSRQQYLAQNLIQE